MSISDLPILSMLRTRMEWHQERQRVLAENVANADTPNYQARDLVPPKFDAAAPKVASLTLARTSPGHLGGSDGSGRRIRYRPQGQQLRGAARRHRGQP